MAFAFFSFDAQLNDFLPSKQKQVQIKHFFKDKASVKDMIQSLGIPHPEVDCIQVNGCFVDFSYIVEDGDIINVYPFDTAPKVARKISLQSTPSIIHFVLDIHLGKLASYLRLFGFDTLYRNDYEDQELASISAIEGRILLTRDRGLLMRSIVDYGYYIRNTNPQQQISEVMQRFKLFPLASPWQRCLRCNGLVKFIPKELIVDKLPEQIKSQIHEFNRCENCGQIYWKGSHYQRLQKLIDEIMFTARYRHKPSRKGSATTNLGFYS